MVSGQLYRSLLGYWSSLALAPDRPGTPSLHLSLQYGGDQPDRRQNHHAFGRSLARTRSDGCLVVDPLFLDGVHVSTFPFPIRRCYGQSRPAEFLTSLRRSREVSGRDIVSQLHSPSSGRSLRKAELHDVRSGP